MEARDIIKRPVITERSSEVMADKSTLSKWTLVPIKLKLNTQLKKFSE